MAGYGTIGDSTLIFSCSGAADVGELSDRVARRMMKTGRGKMFCLAGIGGHVEDIVNKTKGASEIIIIDGCSTLCGKKALEHIGLEGKTFNLEDLGFKKGNSPATGDTIDRVFTAIKDRLDEKISH